MYSYKQKIGYYEENRIFLSHSYPTKNDFLKKYNASYIDKEKSKQLYLQVIYELKAAISEGNIKNFKKISKILSYIVNTKNAELLNCFDEDIYPLKNTSVIILACEYSRLEILKQIFSDYSSLYACLNKNGNRSISPKEEDEKSHNAFYYSIRAGNIQLLETLINEWPGNYFESQSTELDEILSKAYEKVKLKNVLLPEPMEFFVEKKLIDLRFFSDSSKKRQNYKISLNNINKRIELVIEQISSLNSINEVSEEFLVILKYVALNIFTLKKQLKVSYDTLPWEEIEFTLTCFISCNTTDEEINTFYHLVLNKVKILKHLNNFANRLAAIQGVIKTCKTTWLLTLPNISREQCVAQIIEKYPEFAELYQDYHKIRDIHTLNVINNYVTLVSSVDFINKEGQLAIIRSLQAIGECLKNTLESPKLSAYTINLLFLSLTKSTRQLVMKLRNSLSHSHSLTKRTEILQNEDVAFFDGIKNDIKKIGFVIKDILYENNLSAIKSIYERIVSCESTDELQEIVSLVKSLNCPSLIKFFYFQETDLTEHENIKDIIMKLKNTIPDQTERQKKILKKMEDIIALQNVQHSNILEDSLTLISHLKNLKISTQTLSMDNNSLRTQKFLCKTSLDNLNSNAVQPRDLKNLNKLLDELLHSCNLKENDDKQGEVMKLFMKLFCTIDIQLGNVHWVNKLRDKLMERSYNDQYDKPKNFTIAKDQLKNQLSLKLLELKNFVNSHNLCKLSDDTTFKNNTNVCKNVLVALEMLIFEILSILGDSLNRLEDNFLFLDENIPLLIGKNLRNHLAHNNVILDIVPSNPLVGLIVTAQKFVQELDKNENKIGISVTEDLEKLKNNFYSARNVISVKQKMFNALESGDFESLKNCISQGADVHARKNDMWTSLHSAAKGGNLNILKFLIDQKVDIQVKSIDRKTPLHIGAEFGNLSIVEFFLKQKYYSVDSKDESSKTPLHYAAVSNHKMIVETLLKYNACTSVKDILGSSPLHYAIQENHKEVAQTLLKKEKHVDTNEVLGGFTSLHLASERGRFEIVKFLINQGANVCAKTDAKATPLHLASLNGHTDVVDLLVKKKADPNARVREGCTPLHYAIENGHKIIADILLNNGADPNVSDKTYGNTPLHYAAKDGYTEIVQSLIRHKANINSVDATNATPLFYAISKGHLKIVEIICQHENAIKNVQSPLSLAAWHGHVKIVNYLIGLKMDVNITDTNGNTALHIAASRGNKDVVALLVKHKVKMNVKNKQGLTPLLYAFSTSIDIIEDKNIQTYFRDIMSNDNFFLADKSISSDVTIEDRAKVVDILLQNGADINDELNGVTVLHYAAVSGDPSIVDSLIRRNVLVNSKDKLGATPLHKAAMFGRKDVVQLLIKNGADVNFTSMDDYTALHWACFVGSYDVVKILLSNDADVNAICKGNLTPLSLAVEQNHTNVVELLMAHKSQIVNVSKGDLILSLKNNNNDILKMLLNNPASKRAINNDFFENTSLLHLAIIKGNEDIIRTLITNGADVNSRGKDNVTPLHVAVNLKKEKTIKILLENGANVNNKISDDTTMLHLVAKDGNSDMIEMLLQYGVDVNAKDVKNRTALELAVSNENLAVVKLLLPHVKRHIDSKGNNNFTLLHIAAQHNENVEVIKYLVTYGADINSKNDLGSKPIHIAAREGREETVKYFLSLGQSIEEPGVSNSTPLHYCSMSNQLKVARYLIGIGANVNAITLSKYTPLHTAVENEADIAFIEFLMEHGAMYNPVNLHGQKPISLSKNARKTNFLSSIEMLWLAVKQNNLEEVRSCINSGAFANAHNSDNVTPLHFAAWKGYDEIVAELVKNKDIANVIGKKGLVPLHYAAKYGHLNVCKTLLAAGAIYNIRGENGKTPLDLSENKDVSNLLRLIHTCFEMISNKHVKVLGIIKKEKDVSVVKAIINACNAHRKSLLAFAILSNFSKVKELKEILQDDISRQLDLAENMAAFERFDEALKLCDFVLKKRIELFGKNNPGILDIQEMIAKILFKQQKYNEALDMLRNICEKYKDLFGENSKEALNARSGIALILHRQGKNKKALDIFQQVYEKQKNILSMSDRNFLNTLIHMGLVLNALGKFDEALEINTKVLNYHKDNFAFNQPDALVARNNIAMVLTNQGKYEQAEAMYRKVYELRKKILGPTHSDTLRALHNVVTVLDKQKKYVEAMKAYEEVLKVQISYLGSDHIDVLNTQLNMGNLLSEQGKHISAFKIYSTCLPEYKKKVGPCHTSVLVFEAKMEATKKCLKYSGQSDLITLINNVNKEARAAVSSGDLKHLQQMLENDVDVNEADEEGRTLLHFAADSGNIDIARALLKHGCILTATTKKGNTPLHVAVAKGHRRIVETFLNHVNRDQLADFINAKTTAGGTTALHVAAKGGDYDVVQILLKHGAVYNPKNKEGKTPLSLSQHERVVHLLELIDSCFKDHVRNGNIEAIRKLCKMDAFLAIANARNDRYMSLAQVAILNKQGQVLQDLLTAIKKAT